MKKLNRELISTADFNSALGMGGIISRTYARNVERINSLDITDDEKSAALDTLYELTTAELTLYKTTYACASTTGPARYNVKKGLTALDKRAEAGENVRAFVATLEKAQQQKNRASAT